MKKNSIVFLVILLFSNSLFAINKSVFDMKISGEFGLLNGTVGEYVFHQDNKNINNLMSRLKWDVFMLPFLEGSISLNLFKYIYVNANGKIGIPCYSGVMQDYDWLNSTPPSSGLSDWLKDDPTELTNYSKHTNQIDHYYNVSGKIGGTLPFGNKIKFSLFTGYEYDYIEFLATEGYTEYKWDNFEQRNLSGDGIRYSQEFNSLLLGFNIDCDLINRFPITTYFQIIPGICRLRALDLHYYTNSAFLDIYKNIFQLEWKLSGYYELNKHNRIGLSTFIEYMPIQKGITGRGDINSDGTLPEIFQGDPKAKGGASRFLYSFALSYQFAL